MADRGVHGIAVKEFQSDSDDFDEWISLFEAGVNIAHRPVDEAAKHALYKEWIPFKIRQTWQNHLQEH